LWFNQDSYGMAVNILRGVVSISNDGNLGTGGITMSNNGQLLTTGPNFATAKTINLRTGGGILASVTGAVATYGGVISGTGGLNVGDATNAGTIILTANNTYRGGTNVAAGTLVAGSNTPFGSGPIQLSGATSALVIPEGLAVAAGATNVLAGTLRVNGTFNAPSVDVQPGGTLMGSGFISGSVTNFGVVRAGNSPGTLTVGGNYTQARSGVLNIAIGSANNYSRLAVVGHANLDGTLHLTLASGFKPKASDNFNILSAGKGIGGAFRSVDSNGPAFHVSYQNGAVDITTGDPRKTDPVFRPSDGTPSSTTALVSDQIFFNSLGSQAGREAAGSEEDNAKQYNAIGLTFDAGQFRLQGQTGQMYGFPLAGQLKLNDRVALDYDIPFEYVELPGSDIFQTGLILNFPTRVVVGKNGQPLSWDVTPTAALALAGNKEIIGAGALSNTVSYRWHDMAFTYGNYISFFEGGTLVNNDPQFPKGTSQQIMKNGLKASIPLGKGWLFEAYGIYTNFFQSAPVSSYYTVGAEVGHHITCNYRGQSLDLGYYSVGFYTDQGNHYNSSHIQFGSAWRF
jgi:autotransporter-associated beta strand protein